MMNMKYHRLRFEPEPLETASPMSFASSSPNRLPSPAGSLRHVPLLRTADRAERQPQLTPVSRAAGKRAASGRLRHAGYAMICAVLSGAALTPFLVLALAVSQGIVVI